MKPKIETLMDKELRKLLEAGIIFPIKNYTWVSNLVLIRNKIRICVNLRDLNRVSLKDHYPLPSIDKILKIVAGLKIFSLMDGFSCYK